MRTALATLALAATLGASAACAFDDVPQHPDQGGATDRRGTARVDDLMRALGLAVRTMPGYAPPEMNERGDIVIRRRQAPAPRANPPLRRLGPDEAQI